MYPFKRIAQYECRALPKLLAIPPSAVQFSPLMACQWSSSFARTATRPLIWVTDGITSDPIRYS
jgi:hypothetical protein